MIFNDCEQISESAIQKIYVFAQRFVDYNDLLHRISMNMLFHGVEILGDVNQAKNYFGTGDYFNTGLYAGLAIEVATQ